MSNIPEKCSRCGAPITWEEGISIVKCEYCGNINYLRNDYINSKFNRDILKKIDQIYAPAKLVLRNKYSKVLFLSSIIFILGSIINKSINDPVKAYKAQIDEVCTRVAFYEKTDASQNKNLVDCKNYMRNSIIILDKISSKLLNESKSNNLIKEERTKASINDEYQYSTDFSWANDAVIKFRTIPGDYRGILKYEIPPKYKLKRIKIECKKIKPLQIAIYNWMTKHNKDVFERIKAINKNKERKYSLYWGHEEEITYKNWFKVYRYQIKYGGPNVYERDNLTKIIDNNDLLSDLKFTKPIIKSNFINQNQCIMNLTNE